jgi:hypothetical protein
MMRARATSHRNRRGGHSGDAVECGHGRIALWQAFKDGAFIVARSLLTH